MSHRIKRVLRTDAERWPNIKGFDVEIETTLSDGQKIIHETFIQHDEFMLRKLLEDQYDDKTVEELWKLIENYGQFKYNEGSLYVEE
jgi:hypothetical protein